MVYRIPLSPTRHDSSKVVDEITCEMFPDKMKVSGVRSYLRDRQAWVNKTVFVLQIAC